MKNTITLTVEIPEEDQEGFVSRVESARMFWKDRGFNCSLYRDNGRKSRLILHFTTKRTVDEFTELIQSDAQARLFFDPIKNSESRVIISFLEQIL